MSCSGGVIWVICYHLSPIVQAKRQAQKGNVEAQVELGMMYHTGEGTTQNYTESCKWFGMAARQGNALGQNCLGAIYAEGLGVPGSASKAVMWYRKAAEQGLSQAQGNLGVMYFDGNGVPKDAAEAVKWYRLAAEQGNPVSLNNLGSCYDLGIGVPENRIKAYALFALAQMADQYQVGDELALVLDPMLKNNIKILKEKMTHEQIAKAQALAKRCFESNYKDCD